ncbi:hypothetical protein [Streptomyces jumonjinensis]|uniref:LPXTG cell wall anchor domain-containing protein n=1 Tax=Streptomyces jumonjinensis TaxID=1945 RepID=A0A646KIT4_STRJU|nr:hypothetical protein [Streptomyces jumonjinensis]MQT01980.1 hypothetical protein [Streptomyces jumonjinensis]
MPASRALAVAAAACAAVGLSAPVAAAGGDSQDHESVHVSLSPHAVHQGGTLTIIVRGCGRGGTITSHAFPRINLNRGDGREDDRGGDGRGGDGREDDRGGDGRGNDNNRADRGGDNRGGDNREENRGNALSVGARIHDHASPGHYNLAVRCHNNNNSSVATAQFRVLPARGALGGLGGSAAPSSAETAIGAGLVATAALGGTLFIARRRRTVGGRA